MKINSVGDDFSYIVFTDGTQYTATDSDKCSSIHREAHVMVKCPTKGKTTILPEIQTGANGLWIPGSRI